MSLRCNFRKTFFSTTERKLQICASKIESKKRILREPAVLQRATKCAKRSLKITKMLVYVRLIGKYTLYGSNCFLSKLDRKMGNRDPIPEMKKVPPIHNIGGFISCFHGNEFTLIIKVSN